MTFLADENIPRPAVIALRAAGHEVRAIAEDAPGVADEEVGKISGAAGSVLLTFDKDFGDLVFQRGATAGTAVVLFRSIPESPDEFVATLDSLLASGAITPGSFCVVSRDRVRIRRFPAST